MKYVVSADTKYAATPSPASNTATVNARPPGTRARCGSSPNPTVVMVMTVMYAHSPTSHAYLPR